MSCNIGDSRTTTMKKKNSDKKGEEDAMTVTMIRTTNQNGNVNHNDLRKLFPDPKTVMIYPDDFYDSDHDNDAIENDHEDDENQRHSATAAATRLSPPRRRLLRKDLSIPELLDRHTGHFSDRRVAVLLKPAPTNDGCQEDIYRDVYCPVGYWTQVLGLGETPSDVTLTGRLGVFAVPANTTNPNVGSLDTFWRSCENITSQTSFVRKDNEWCVPVVATNNKSSNSSSSNKNNNNNNKMTSKTEWIPVGDLTDPTWGYPPSEIPPSSIDPSRGMLWAVSQAAPLRRICINAGCEVDDSTENGRNRGSSGGGPTLHLSLGPNCASGGFMSNCFIDDGYVAFGSQQQWCCRNISVGQKAAGGAWSFVLVGSDKTSSSDNNKCSDLRHDPRNTIEWATKPGLKLPLISRESKTPGRIEKPFLFVGKNESLFLGIPDIQYDSVGFDHRPMSASERVEIHLGDDCEVKVVTPQHPFYEIQQAVSQGKHIVLNPGTYQWDQTLQLCPTTTRQVILGIGMATVQAPGKTGRPCIYVPPTARGVRISGISLEASRIDPGNYEGSCLLQWGDLPSDTGGTQSLNRPSGAIHDLYCFVGGRSLDRMVSVETMVKIYSSYVVGDNLWLWRADHVKLRPDEQPNRPELSEYHVTTYGECRCDVGLAVYGDHVTMYGLAVEHTYKDMVQWFGHHGSVYFHQSELPYDVSGSVYNNTNPGTAAYKVHNTAQYHVAKGVGVYSYFRDYDDVDVPSPVSHHATTGRYENVFTVWLNGHRGLMSVINGRGEATSETGKPYVVPVYISGAVWYSYFFPSRLGYIIESILNACQWAWEQFRTLMTSNNNWSRKRVT